MTSVSVVDCIIAPSRTSCAAQREAVGQVAVVADGEAAAVELGEQRLDVAQDGLAGGRVAHVADRRHAGQPVDHLAAGEIVADESHPPLGMESPAVERHDARRFLAAVLKGMQAERGDGCGVGMPENAEYAAFLAQPVGFEIERASFAAGTGCSAHRVARRSDSSVGPLADRPRATPCAI